MATTKSTTTKSSPAKRPAPVATATAAKAKPATKVAAKPEPVAAKPQPVAKPESVTKAKAPPKAAAEKPAAKPATSRAKKPATIAPEQRQYYIEVAAYHIAERRGFQPGNDMDDWAQAEAEIDRLLADGLLGN